ncbi:MAG: tetratricopeptide repeat protein [Phycisphaerae bacterium]|nr:tetratricopeptide repeat protein [Phycisphaerae bacterium]
MGTPLDITESLDVGRAHQRKGRLAEATAVYREVLEREPNNGYALHLLGLIALQQGNKPEGIRLIREAIQHEALNAHFHLNLGKALHESGQLPEAARCYQRAAQLNPRLSEPQWFLGRLQEGQGRVEDAIRTYGAALRLAQGPKAGAGGKLVRQRAEAALERHLAEARLATQAAPTSAQALCRLGVALEQRERGTEAASCYRQATEFDPNDHEAHILLGAYLQGETRTEEAIDCYRRARELRPDVLNTTVRLGICLSQVGRLAEAADCYDQALAIRPDCGQARLGSATLQLAQGDFINGWANYEARLTCTPISRAKWDLPQPRWDGSSLRGKTVLLLAEQGLGDTIQFIRFAKEVQDRGGTVVAEVQPPLGRLLREVEGVDRLITVGQERPDFDLHTTLMSLPAALGTTVETIPADIPYLRAEAERVRKWKQALDATGYPEGKRIGFAWWGRSDHLENPWRSVHLDQLAPIVEAAEDVMLVNLQKGEGTEQIAECGFADRVVDFGDRLDAGPDAFVDTAAIIENLDLVITVDSAVAHVAGALGKPTWILLHWPADWRWLLEREDSPWYPSVRLFRQDKRGQWAPVVKQATAALRRQLEP